MLPFTQAQYLDVFRQYHEGVGPAWALVLMMVVVGISFAFWDNRVAGRVVSGSLAVIWLWAGLVYHAKYFSRISSAGPAFAALFVIQAGIFVWAGMVNTGLRFHWANDLRGWLGAIAALYAFTLHPALAFVLHQYYPSAPSFAVPGPVDIVTMALLLWSNASWRIWAIPVLWAIIGTAMGVMLNSPQDYALAVVALLLVALPPRKG